MSSSCKECGHPTEWAQDIGSAVCTQCGTLADSSQQSALTSSADFINNTYHHLPSSSTCARPTLKSIRRNTAWDLPGQGSDSRNERKKVLRLLCFSRPFPPFSHRIALLSSPPMNSFVHSLIVWDIMVPRPALKPSLTPLYSALPLNGVKQPNSLQAPPSCSR